MRLSPLFLVLTLAMTAPAARAEGTSIASDLNAAFTVATPDNAPALGLDSAPACATTASPSRAFPSPSPPTSPSTAPSTSGRPVSAWAWGTGWAP